MTRIQNLYYDMKNMIKVLKYKYYNLSTKNIIKI